MENEKDKSEEMIENYQCPTCGEVNRIFPDANLYSTKCKACGVILKDIEPGYNYLLIDNQPANAIELFFSLIKKGNPGLCISTTFPDVLKKKHSLANADVLWLTDISASDYKILNPCRLEFEIIRVYASFVKNNKDAVIVLDGFEYMVVENGFEKVFKFLKKINDLASVNSATLFIPIAPSSIKENQLIKLKREFDKIIDFTDIKEMECEQENSEDMEEDYQCPTCGEMNHVFTEAILYTTKCKACETILEKIESGYNYLIMDNQRIITFELFVSLIKKGAPGLCISTTIPDKLRKLHNLEDVDIIWLTNSSALDHKTVNPCRLEFEMIGVYASFVKNNKDAVIVLDGFEYMVVENGFEKVFKFLKKINDLASVNSATLFIPIAPSSIKENQLIKLKRDFDKIIDFTDIKDKQTDLDENIHNRIAMWEAEREQRKENEIKEVYLCPICGKPLSSGDGCEICGWKLGELMSANEELINRAQSKGLLINPLQDKLIQAKSDIDAGNWEVALDIALQINNDVKKIMVIRDCYDIRDLLIFTEELVWTMQNKGIDVEVQLEKLASAKSEFEAGNYDSSRKITSEIRKENRSILVKLLEKLQRNQEGSSVNKLIESSADLPIDEIIEIWGDAKKVLDAAVVRLDRAEEMEAEEKWADANGNYAWARKVLEKLAKKKGTDKKFRCCPNRR